MSQTKLFLVSVVVVFLLTFNLGYVFHDVALGAWFHEQEGPLAREHFIVPLIGVAFFVYALALAHLFPAYRQRYPNRSVVGLGVQFGVLMGVVFDALQGGIIEYATFNLPFAVFVVDSSYHVFVEGSLAGLALGLIHRRWAP